MFSNEQEKMLKDAAYERPGHAGNQCQEQTTGGMLGMDLDSNRPMRDGLRRRIEERIGRAEREQMKATRLYELRELLQKHPDVARILELMEETQ